MSLIDLSHSFPAYTEHSPEVPVWCITPRTPRALHRFFDTSPISPSGRYLALTQLPYDDRLPVPGDPATVIVVDLATGDARPVAETRGWDTQLGAQAQWGGDDTQLFFNDLDVRTWGPFGVRMDPLNGTRKELGGTVYMVAPDGRRAASPCLLRTRRTQAGYGVVAPPEAIPENDGAPADDGLFVTDTETSECRLVASLKRIADACPGEFHPEELASADLYGFHVKWNPQGDRLMFVVRAKDRTTGQLRARLITLRPDGGDIRVAVPAAVWADRGGHHPDWHPDGLHVTMNLNLHGDGMRIITVRYDGVGLGELVPGVKGSGHPRLHPDETHIVTDAYQYESMAFGDGTTPIRWIDVRARTERDLIRIRTQPYFQGPKGELRVDPHPAWDRGFRRIVFNACPDGRRGVFIADPPV